MDSIYEECDFSSDEVKSRFTMARNPWVTEVYIYLINNRVVSFLFMMEENLECGFLHYHIAAEHKECLINKYPVLNGKTNQIFYVYTDVAYRRKGIASALLRFVCDDMSQRSYSYIWLKKETASSVYKHVGFENFLSAIQRLFADPDEFISDYQSALGCDKLSFIKKYNDVRLVKLLGDF